jgi:hypothetical protein
VRATENPCLHLKSRHDEPPRYTNERRTELAVQFPSRPDESTSIYRGVVLHGHVNSMGSRFYLYELPYNLPSNFLHCNVLLITQQKSYLIRELCSFVHAASRRSSRRRRSSHRLG